MPAFVPLAEEGPVDDRPIAVQPGLHESFRPGLLQPQDVRRVIPHEQHVIPDLTGDEHAVEADRDLSTFNLEFFRLGDDLEALRAGVNVSGFYPKVARAARIASKPHPTGDTRARAKSGTKLVDRTGAGEVGDFLDVDAGVAVALVLLRISVLFEVDKLQPCAVLHRPGFLLNVVRRTDLGEDLMRARDNFGKLGELAPNEDADGVLAVEEAVLEPVPDGGFSLPAAPGTAVEDFENGTFEQGGLRPGLGFPDDLDVSGDHRRG